MERVEGPPGQILDALVSGIKVAWGDELVAVWLYGSSVTGHFEAGVSDIDIIAVTSTEMQTTHLVGLKRMHDDLVARHAEWTDRIEVVYIAQATLESFRSSDGVVAVISPGEPLHVRDDRPDAWLQNWYLVRETGVALHGPEPERIVPPIEWSEFVQATARYADEVANRDRAVASAGALAYDILTMCRALRTVRTDTVSSKLEAAAWVGIEMPAWRWLIDGAVDLPEIRRDDRLRRPRFLHRGGDVHRARGRQGCRELVVRSASSHPCWTPQGAVIKPRRARSAWTLASNAAEARSRAGLRTK